MLGFLSSPITKKGVLSPTLSLSAYVTFWGSVFIPRGGRIGVAHKPTKDVWWLTSQSQRNEVTWHPQQYVLSKGYSAAPTPPPISRVRAGSLPATLNVRDICPSGTCMLTLNLTYRAQGPFGPFCRPFVVGQSMNYGSCTKERPYRLTQALLPRWGMSGGERAQAVLSLSTREEFCGQLRHRPCSLWGRLGQPPKVWLTLTHLCPFNQYWWPLSINWPC